MLFRYICSYGICSNQKITRHNGRTLVYQLVKCVLPIGSGFPENYRAGFMVHRITSNGYGLAV